MENKPLTHTELTQIVAKKLNLPIRQVMVVISAAGEAISNSLVRGTDVKVAKLGVLTSCYYTHRHPSYGEQPCFRVSVRVHAGVQRQAKLQARLKAAESDGK